MTSFEDIGRKENQLSVKHQPQNPINRAQMTNTLVAMDQVANILVVKSLIKPEIESRVFICASDPTEGGEKADYYGEQ